MRLLRLECHNLAQYADLDLDLSGITEAAITGVNAVGKSQMMQMPHWCLYGRPIRGTTDSLIRDDEREMWVRTTWSRDGQEIVVKRTRSIETKAGASDLQVWHDGEILTRSTIPATQAVLDALVGLSSDQLLAGPWMAQGRSDVLMGLKPGPRSALVTSLFDLDRFAPWHERAKEWLSVTERGLSISDDRRKRLEEHIAEEPETRGRLEDARHSLDVATSAAATHAVEIAALTQEAQQLREDEQRAEALSREIAAIRDNVNALEAGIDQYERLVARYRTLAARPVPPEEADGEFDLGALNTAADQWAMASQAKASGLAELPLHRKALADAEEHAGWQHALCETCPFRDKGNLDEMRENVAFVERKIAVADGVMERRAGARQRLDAALAAHSSYAARQEARAAVLASVEEARSKLPELESAVAAASAQRTAAFARVAELDAERWQLKQSQDQAMEVAHALDTAKLLHHDALMARDECQRRVGALEDAVAAIESAKVALTAIDATLADQNKRASGLRIVTKMFHRTGLPSSILESSLSLLEAKANEMLARMPGDLAIRFRTQVQTKTGTWSDEFGIDVEEAGRIRDYEVLGGAFRFRIDLALRMAIGSVLSHRTGTGFETAFLDEPLGEAQDAQSFESVLQSIGAVAGDFGLLLLITHRQDVADRFSVRLEVVDVDGRSEVRVA